ncbi:hypothetical protein BDZ89DRAFT_1067153 [Hymenopellis radicata]|nr:hypothetical protein BDZ89DRAFT_1067153 [Hymenopellis radicata]
MANLSPARGSQQKNSRSGAGIKPGFEEDRRQSPSCSPSEAFTTSINTKTWAAVNLDRLQFWIDQGQTYHCRELLLSGCIHDAHDGIKILGDGSSFFKSKIWITPSRASKSAVKAIEANGGTVVCKYYNPLALRDCIHGRTDRTEAAPTRREDIVWYGRDRNRGYLSPPYLEKLGDLPFVQDRWKVLAKELGAWRKQEFDMRKVKRQ